MNRIDRLLGYLLILHNREVVRAQDLARRFEVSERTVYRDMQALSEVGVPLAAMPGEGYRLLDGFYLPPVVFSEEEARALLLAIGLFRGLISEGDTHQAAGTALEKIRAVLPGRALARLNTLQEIIGFYTISRAPLDLDDPLFIKLLEAIQQRHVLQIDYHALSTNTVTRREVEPLSLDFIDTVWLMSGYCRLRQDVRHFRLARIDRLVVRPETFVPRVVNLPPRRFAALEVEVLFAADVARWVIESEPQGVVEQWTAADGRLGLRLQRSDTQQLKRWILGWGEAAEVIAPAALRDEMAATAAALYLRYHPPSG